MSNKSENTDESTEVLKAEKSQKTVVREYAEALIIALILALLIRTFVIQAFKIPTGSMEPTLLVGDHLLVSKFSYSLHIPNEIPFTSIQLFPDYHFFSSVPERGNIVVFKFPLEPDKDFIKRVVGLPGETIQIIQQRVYINDKLLKEPYAHHSQPPSPNSGNRDNMAPLRIPEGHIFVMGDNRENSHDSRMWGVLDLKNLRGKAQWIYWSWDSKDTGLRTDRLGTSVYR
ncbi:MAG: signal peptidase I [Nitrospinota bacterium]|nr:signal peptidase I [Nitrospinota bacterium]